MRKCELLDKLRLGHPISTSRGGGRGKEEEEGKRGGEEGQRRPFRIDEGTHGHGRGGLVHIRWAPAVVATLGGAQAPRATITWLCCGLVEIRLWRRCHDAGSRVGSDEANTRATIEGQQRRIE